MAKERQMKPQGEAGENQPQQQQITLPQAIQIVDDALNKGAKTGAYTLKESSMILSCWEGIIAQFKAPAEE